MNTSFSMVVERKRKNKERKSIEKNESIHFMNAFLKANGPVVSYYSLHCDKYYFRNERYIVI